MSRLAKTLWGLAVALPLACSQQGYETPSPDTLPVVSIGYPKFYLDEDPSLRPVTFGEASADLPVTIVGREEGGRVHVIDFGLPREATMHGYGEYAGMTERYSRTRMQDARGVHGIRLSVYRTDSGRKHTNVWTHFLARAQDAQIFLTEQGQWDWIGGEQDTSDFSRGAWPFFPEIQRSHYFYNSFFGFSPGIYSRTEYITQVVLSTTATSPSYGIENCVQVLFNSVDPTLKHQAFLHERYGLVEMVYRWHDLDPRKADDHPIVALDGFAAPPATLEELPKPATTENELAGTWRGAVQLLDDRGRTSPLDIQLELKASGLAYRELSNSFDVEGSFNAGEMHALVRGRYHRSSRTLKLVEHTGSDMLELAASVPAGSPGRLSVSLYRYNLVTELEHEGTGELRLSP